MKCDKCGFEHNSRTVCPKCNANVIFVNEDYERRKREWENAQKNGKDNIPPGIMYSTREEHNTPRDMGKAVKPKEKGGSEKAGLSFDVVREKLNNIIFKIKISKKRNKKENPPVKQKKSNRTVPKFYKKRTRQIVIPALILTAVLITAVILVNCLKKHSRVLFFDGNAAYYDGSNNAVMEIKGKSKVEYYGQGVMLITDEESVHIFSDGRISEIDAENPEIIAYNDRLTAIIYRTGSDIFYYDGTVIQLNIEGDMDKEACFISSDGDYFAITSMVNDNDEFTSRLYYGNIDNYSEICIDNNRKKIIDADKNGVVYINMSDAEYGIINERKILYYSAGVSYLITDDFTDYVYMGMLYYLDQDNRLYSCSGNTKYKIDDEVSSFCQSSDGVFYLKDDGCHMAEGTDEYPGVLFKTDAGNITVYYSGNTDFLYYTDISTVYYVSGAGALPSEVCSINYGDSLIWNGKHSRLYITDKDRTLYELGIVPVKIEEDVCGLEVSGNDEAYSYIRGNNRYLIYNDGNNRIKLPALKWDVLLYSDKYYYWIDEKNDICKIKTGRKKYKKAGTARICIFVP